MRYMATTHRLAAALALAASAVVLGQGTAYADPEPAPAPAPAPEQPAPAPAPAPAGNVVYTITTGAPYEFDLYYITSQPPSMAAYQADAYSFLRSDRHVTITPDQPWVFSTNLADPQWANVSASSTAHGGMAPPNAHCIITVDGQVVQDVPNPYSPRCQLANW